MCEPRLHANREVRARCPAPRLWRPVISGCFQGPLGSAFAFSSFSMYLNQKPSVGIFFSHNFFKLGVVIRTPTNSPFSSGRSGGPGVDWLLQFFLCRLVSVEPVWGSGFFLCVSPGREGGRPAFHRGCLRPVVPRWLGLCPPAPHVLRAQARDV